MSEANALRETGASTKLDVGAVADGQYLRRVGTTVVGAAGGGGAGGVALTGVAPPAVANTSALGVSVDAAAGDHTHAHGSQTVGTHHAAVISGSTSGFMTGSDKAKLDGVESLADVTDAANVAAAGAVMTTRTVSTSSPLAGGGALSADLTLSLPAATASAAGHATAAQIAKLDGIATGAAALTAVAPLALGTAAVGVATVAARGDHVHAHGAQTDGAMHAAAVAGGASGFLTGADKTKLDGIATSATRGLTTTSARATATQALTAIAVANLTSLSLAVTTGVTYGIRVRLLFTSAAITTGLRFAFTHPGGTLSVQAAIPIAADGAAGAWSGQHTASADVVQGTGVEALSTTYCALFEGVYVCTVSGTLQCQGGTEVAASAITIQAGSHIVLEVIP